MRLPENWFNEFEEYNKEMFYGNDGIYDDFNDVQMGVIKAYFRWRSRDRFYSLCKDTRLETKPKKAEVLSAVMGGATDWQYDGCVDTGFLGGGHCELGHALRYEHYALSPSLGGSIIFGVNCAADFFGIEPERLKKINSVQDDTLREIKIVAFIIQTGKLSQYVQNYYPDLRDVLEVLAGSCDDTFGFQWNHMMADFLKAGLPWTPSMVDRYKWVKRTFYEKRKVDLDRQRTAEALFKGSAKDSELFQKISTQPSIHYIKTIMAYIATKSNDDSDLQIRRNKALVKLGSKYLDALKVLESIGVANNSVENFCRLSKISQPYIQAKNGKRVATKNEISAGVPGIFFEEISHLTNERYQQIQLIGWAFAGNKTFYKNADCGSPDEFEMDKLELSAIKMDAALKWILNTTGKSDLLELKNKEANPVYKDSADDEVKAEETLDTMAEYIVDNVGKIKTNEWVVSAGNDIASKYLTNKKIKLTPKQINVVRRAHDYIKAYKGEARKTPLNTNNKYIIHAQELLDNKDSQALKNDKCKFALKIAASIVTSGKVSDKQAYHIEAAYKLLEQEIKEKENYAKAMGDGTAMVLSFDRYGNVVQVPTPRADEVSETSEASEEYPTEPEFIAKKEKKKSSKDTVYSGIGSLPSIVAMSDALGLGVFKGN